MAWKKEQSAVYGSANKISDVFGKSPFLQFFTQYGNPTNGSGAPTSVIVFGTDTLNDVANQYCKSQGQAGASDVATDVTRPAIGLGGAGGAFCILFMGNVSGFENKTITHNSITYIACLVGCTYHCGWFIMNLKHFCK